jgi:hypothetical protein
MTASVINDTYASGPPPSFTGGTIADGTYNLTASQLYGVDGGTGNTGNTSQESAVVSGTTIQIVVMTGSSCSRGRSPYRPPRTR